MAKEGEWVIVKTGVVDFKELACKPVALFLIIMGVTEEAPAGTLTTIEVPAPFAFTVTFTGPK